MKVYTIEDIREALKDRILSVVSENTGIHKNTLYRIANKEQKTMQLETYSTLVKYLFPVHAVE